MPVNGQEPGVARAAAAVGPADGTGGATSLVERLTALLRQRRNAGQLLPLLASLLAVGVIFQSLSGLFLDPRNLGNMFTEGSPLALVAVASTLMIIMGEIDLSLGSVAGLTAAIAAGLMTAGFSWWTGVAMALGCAALIGMAHGAVVVVAGVRSFVVTLAGFLIWYGVQLMLLRPSGYIPVTSPVIAGIATLRLPFGVSAAAIGIFGLLWIAAALAGQRHAPGSARKWVTLVLARAAVLALLLGVVFYLQEGGGLPLLTAIVIAITGTVSLALTKTAPGRHLYAIGGNMFAAKEHGVRVDAIKFGGFIATSLLAGVAGLALLSYTAGVDNSTGTGTLLLAGIGASVVGGVSLAGGRGSVWGALGGALLLGGVQNGLNLLNLTIDMVYVVEGAVVMAALLVDAALRRQLLAR